MAAYDDPFYVPDQQVTASSSNSPLWATVRPRCPAPARRGGAITAPDIFPPTSTSIRPDLSPHTSPSSSKHVIVASAGDDPCSHAWSRFSHLPPQIDGTATTPQLDWSSSRLCIPNARQPRSLNRHMRVGVGVPVRPRLIPSWNPLESVILEILLAKLISILSSLCWTVASFFGKSCLKVLAVVWIIGAKVVALAFRLRIASHSRQQFPRDHVWSRFAAGPSSQQNMRIQGIRPFLAYLSTPLLGQHPNFGPEVTQLSSPAGSAPVFAAPSFDSPLFKKKARKMALLQPEASAQSPDHMFKPPPAHFPPTHVPIARTPDHARIPQHDVVHPEKADIPSSPRTAFKIPAQYPSTVPVPMRSFSMGDQHHFSEPESAKSVHKMTLQLQELIRAGQEALVSTTSDNDMAPGLVHDADDTEGSISTEGGEEDAHPAGQEFASLLSAIPTPQLMLLHAEFGKINNGMDERHELQRHAAVKSTKHGINQRDVAAEQLRAFETAMSLRRPGHLAKH